jgi:hypothetical protein
MRVRRLIGLPFFALTIAAVASAQPVQPAPEASQAPAGTPPTSPQGQTPPAGTGEPPKPEELVAQGEGILRRGMAISKSVRTMLESARKDADIIRITCLDDKLTQINANLRSAETRIEALRKAVDADLRVHEYTVLSVLGNKLEVLDQEAHQCVGEEMYETGETTVVTEIDTDMLPFEETPSVPPVVLPPSLPTVPPSVPPSASGIR